MVRIPFSRVNSSNSGSTTHQTSSSRSVNSTLKTYQFLEKSSKFFYNKVCPSTHIIQKFLKYDNDYRAIVLDGKCIGIIERVPQKDEFRANISRGAIPKEVSPDQAKDVELLAEKTAKILGSD